MTLGPSVCWHIIDTIIAYFAVPAAALCVGGVDYAALTGVVAISAVALSPRGTWLSTASSLLIAIITISNAGSSNSHRFFLAIACCAASTLMWHQRKWRDLAMGDAEGVLAVQVLSAGALCFAETIFGSSASITGIDGVISTLLGGTCAICILLFPLIHTRSRMRSARTPLSTDPQCFTRLTLREESWVWSCIIGIIFGLEYPLIWRVLGIEPIVWAQGVLIGTPALLGLVVWWIFVAIGLIACAPKRRIAASIPANCIASADAVHGLAPHHRLLIIRKLFHAAVVVMFVPALFVLRGEVALSLAFACAVKALCIFEILRCLKARPIWISSTIDSYMNSFTDERDSGVFILTHLYLLLGCAAPWWFAPRCDFPRHLSTLSLMSLNLSDTCRPFGISGAVPLAGIAVLGVGDAAAAVVGIFCSAYGRAHKWGSILPSIMVYVSSRPTPVSQVSTATALPPHWPGSRKTVEGTAAFIVLVITFLAIIHTALQWLRNAEGSNDRYNVSATLTAWAHIFFCTTVTSIFETFTGYIDNATLPAIFFVCLRGAAELQ
jgi:hypothetical protein